MCVAIFLLLPLLLVRVPPCSPRDGQASPNSPEPHLLLQNWEQLTGQCWINLQNAFFNRRPGLEAWSLPSPLGGRIDGSL